ncbi:MAG: hypothetical protein JXR37_24405 [Kiritimatiellae bacterium]|nr:hypothetical protein [Kiritimatiellia bacterium]
MKPREEKNESDDESTNIDGVIRAALQSAAWAVPQCEEEVAHAEERLSGKALPLPPALNEPASAWARGGRPARGVEPKLELPASPDVDRTLARAARERGCVSPEIEATMRRDREAAEVEFDERDTRNDAC